MDKKVKVQDVVTMMTRLLQDNLEYLSVNFGRSMEWGRYDEQYKLATKLKFMEKALNDGRESYQELCTLLERRIVNAPIRHTSNPSSDRCDILRIEAYRELLSEELQRYVEEEF